MFKKIAFLFMAIALATVSAVGIGCTPQKGIPAIDLVPRQANFVVDVNLHQIFSDPDVLYLVNEIGAKFEEPKTIDELLLQLEHKTGIDLRDFSKILIFGATDFEQYVGAIVKGEFDQENPIATIVSKSDLEITTISYKGYELYLVTDEDEDMAISLLDDNSIALGTTETVKDVIDVKEGASPLDEPLRTSYDALGNVWAKAALEMPTEALDIVGEFPLPGLESFRNIEVIGLSFDKSCANISLQVKILFPSSAGAEDARGAFDALTGILAFVPDLPNEVVEIVDSLNVTQTDSWVTISFETTSTEIQAWVEALVPIFEGIGGIQ